MKCNLLIPVAVEDRIAGAHRRTTAAVLRGRRSKSSRYRFTYGFTNRRAAVSLTVWPRACSLRAQWWALAQASVPTRHAGTFAKKVAIWLRLRCFYRTALPCQLRPAGRTPKKNAAVE